METAPILGQIKLTCTSCSTSELNAPSDSSCAAISRASDTFSCWIVLVFKISLCPVKFRRATYFIINLCSDLLTSVLLIQMEVYYLCCCCCLPCNRCSNGLYGLFKKFWPMVISCVLRFAGSSIILKFCRPAYFVRSNQLLPHPGYAIFMCVVLLLLFTM